MINTLEVNRSANLLSLAGMQLKPVASTGGGEFAGPCPKCGGRDRFRVQPYHKPYPIWMCHHCTASKWQDAISLGRLLWPGLPFREVCERIAGGPLPVQTRPNSSNPDPLSAYAPPSPAWQALARQLIADCEARLWQPVGSPALAFLRARGLKDKTIRRFRLGFNPSGVKLNGHYWLDRGITIPAIVSGETWYLKVRRPESESKQDKRGKYTHMTGSQSKAIFNANDLGNPLTPALICEGEFDCMIAWQELNHLLPVATFGSAGNLPDLATWGGYLTPHPVYLVAYDNDEAGKQGLERLLALSHRFHPVAVPSDYHDVNDYYLAGGNLESWILPAIQAHQPFPADSMLSAALSLGAQCANHEEAPLSSDLDQPCATHPSYPQED